MKYMGILKLTFGIYYSCNEHQGGGEGAVPATYTVIRIMQTFKSPLQFHSLEIH